jgi:hypothetical protein
MPAWTRRHPALSGTVLLLVVGVVAWPVGRDMLRAAHYQRQIAAEARRDAEIEARQAEVAQLSARKRGIAAAYLAGRLTLPEAASVFRSLHAGDRHADLFRLAYRDDSPDRCLCHNVAAFAEVVINEQRPRRADALRARVAAELRACLETEDCRPESR